MKGARYVAHGMCIWGMVARVPGTSCVLCAGLAPLWAAAHGAHMAGGPRTCRRATPHAAATTAKQRGSEQQWSARGSASARSPQPCLREPRVGAAATASHEPRDDSTATSHQMAHHKGHAPAVRSRLSA